MLQTFPRRFDATLGSILSQYLLLAVFVVTVTANTYSSLSSSNVKILSLADKLVSPLGRFQLSVVPSSCRVFVKAMSGPKSRPGFYPKYSIPSSFSSIQVRKGQVRCGSNLTLGKLSLKNINKTNIDYSVLTVDDLGIIRFNTYMIGGSQQIEVRVAEFRQPQANMYTFSTLTINNDSIVNLKSNSGSWAFIARLGTFRLFSILDPNLMVQYSYEPFILSRGRVVGANVENKTTNLLNDIKFNLFNGNDHCYMLQLDSFQPPFLFYLDKYWPIARIMSQNGIELISIRYPIENCLNLGASSLVGGDRCLSWVCPPQTFELDGQCLTTCPNPYFHQIDKNQRNRCVLNCQYGLQYQFEDGYQYCSCQKIAPMNCPPRTFLLPISCQCPQHTFFLFGVSQYGPLNQYDGACLSQCPQGMIGLAQVGRVCLTCSLFCLKCQKVAVFQPRLAFLKCIECKKGWKVRDGFCIKNNQCDDHCADCSDSGMCLRCLLPHSLEQGKCKTECSNNLRPLLQEQGYICRSVPFCTDMIRSQTPKSTFEPCTLLQDQQCNVTNTVRYVYLLQTECICSQKKNGLVSAYVPFCKKVVINGCPNANQVKNPFTNECQKCPIGCLTCWMDLQGFIDCNSCAHDYFLDETGFEFYECKRIRGPIDCEGNVKKWVENERICESTSMIESLLLPNRNGLKMERSFCLKKISNCKRCGYSSTEFCLLCSSPFIYFEGQCRLSCPSTHFRHPFQPVCLKINDPGCQVSFLVPRTILFYPQPITRDLVLSFEMLSPRQQEDPFWILHTWPIGVSSQQRVLKYRSSQQKCLSCREGYTLNPLTELCLACNRNCRSCKWQSLKCNMCSEGYGFNAEERCIPTNMHQVDCEDGQFRKDSMICSRRCQGFYRPFKGIKRQANCTKSCPDSFSILEAKDGRLVCWQPTMNHSEVQSYLSPQKKVSDLELKLTISYELVKEKLLKIVMIPSVPVSNFLSASNGQQTMDYIQASNRAGQLLMLTFKRLNSNVYILSIDLANCSQPIVYLTIPVTQFAALNKTTGQKIVLGNSVHGILFDQSYRSIQDKSGMGIYGRFIVCLIISVTIMLSGQQINYVADNIHTALQIGYLALLSSQFRFGGLTSGAWLIEGLAWGFGVAFYWFDDEITLPIQALLLTSGGIDSYALSGIVLLSVAASIQIIVSLLHKICSKQSVFSEISRKTMLLVIFYLEGNLSSVAYVLYRHNLYYYGLTLAFYCGFRCYYNIIAGLYCLRRTLLGLAMAIVTLNNFYKLMLLIVVQVIFALLRIQFEAAEQIKEFLITKKPSKHLSKTQLKADLNVSCKRNKNQMSSNTVVGRGSLKDTISKKYEINRSLELRRTLEHSQSLQLSGDMTLSQEATQYEVSHIEQDSKTQIPQLTEDIDRSFPTALRTICLQMVASLTLWILICFNYSWDFIAAYLLITTLLFLVSELQRLIIQLYLFLQPLEKNKTQIYQLIKHAWWKNIAFE